MSTNLGDTAEQAEFALLTACDTCGFVADEVAPQDAMTALRSFPPAWRSALALRLDDADPAGVLTGRTSPTGWSALEHAGHVRDVLHALDIRLQRVLREDEPVLPETHVTPPSGADEQGVAVILAALTVSTDQFSATIEFTPAGAWSRRALRRGRMITALDLIREAVHEGRHHLSLATETLAELRTTPV
jgi:hypothetical protein